MDVSEEKETIIDRVSKIIEEMHIPFSYSHFAEGENVPVPFICYLIPSSSNFSAEGSVYLKIDDVDIELYTDFKDIKTEEKVEAVLKKYGIFYDKTENYIEEEELYCVTFSFSISE